MERTKEFIEAHRTAEDCLHGRMDQNHTWAIPSISIQEPSWSWHFQQKLLYQGLNTFQQHVQYFFPVSFHIITHDLIYGHQWFDFFSRVKYKCCYQHLVKCLVFHVNGTFRDLLTEESGDMLCTYLFYLLYIAGNEAVFKKISMFKLTFHLNRKDEI